MVLWLADLSVVFGACVLVAHMVTGGREPGWLPFIPITLGGVVIWGTLWPLFV